MTEAQICPVCNGRQKMPEAFYFGSTDSSGTGDVQCRSCGGIGYILINEIYSYS